MVKSDRDLRPQHEGGEGEKKTESEVKVLEIDRAAVDGKLAETGAKEVSRAELVNITRDTNDYQLHSRGFTARVRKIRPMRLNKGGAWEPTASKPAFFEWTIKGTSDKESKNKRRSERNSRRLFRKFEDALKSIKIQLREIAELADIKESISSITEHRRVTKRRVTYHYPKRDNGSEHAGTKVDIDEIVDVSINGKEVHGVSIPPFLEVEAPESDDPEADDRKIEGVVAALGLTLHPKQRKWSERKLLKHYGIVVPDGPEEE